jgi:hypothetical protein
MFLDIYILILVVKFENSDLQIVTKCIYTNLLLTEIKLNTPNGVKSE